MESRLEKTTVSVQVQWAMVDCVCVSIPRCAHRPGRTEFACLLHVWCSLHTPALLSPAQITPSLVEYCDFSVAESLWEDIGWWKQRVGSGGRMTEGAYDMGVRVFWV